MMKLINRVKVYCFLILQFLGISIFSAITPIEQNIAQYVIKKKQEQLLLLEQLVNINSSTVNIQGVRDVGEVLRKELDALGFTTKWEMPPNNVHRAGTLVATHVGTQGKRILLIGHLDTVFSKENVSQKFEISKEDNNLAKGQGIVDDKGGDVAIIYALKALKVAGALEEANITVVLTGDEENAGKPVAIAKKPLLDAAKNSDVALEFEWAFTNDTVTVARRGISHWTLKTQSKEAHSSTIFQKAVGYGAIFETARILEAMRLDVAHEKDLTFNPGLIVGGNIIRHEKNESKGEAFGPENIIAKDVIVQGDLRYLTVKQKKNVEKRMVSILNKNLFGTKAVIDFEDEIPNMAPTKANFELLNKYSAISVKLNYGAVKAFDPSLRGASDISYVALIVSASLAGLGPIGKFTHTQNETLLLDSLPKQTQRAALLIYNLTKS